ncbi:MAG TPA: hypothetical protein VFE78_21105 [Gemmataceae bacterium]|jgi:hypothetical protein|nr:hypothetical protein [Gemmataceae bacterium]
MTARERVLATGVLGVVVLMGGGMLFHLFLYTPLSELQNRVATARADYETKQADLDKEKADKERILKLNPRLAEWKRISLPAARKRTPEELRKGVTLEESKKRHINKVQSDYDEYLSGLLRRSGFNAATINITPRVVENRTPGQNRAAAAREPLFTRLAFTVQGRARLEAVEKALEELYKTNLLHEVRNLSVQNRPGPVGTLARGRPGELDVNMTVEVLMASGAETREALTPGTDVPARALAEPARTYADLAAKNIFLGTAAQTRLTEDRIAVLEAVRLTTLSHNGRRWEAYLYDQAKGGAEKRLNALTVTDFAIKDKYGTAVLEGKVVLIDERQLVFQSEGKFYRLRCGDFLYPAVEHPLTESEIKPLGVAKAP